MRLMKKLLAIVFAVAFLFLAKPALATEGTATLDPVGSSTASCFVASIYRGQYQVMGSCRNLPTAYDAERNRFFVWFQDERGNWMPMGETDHGKFQFTSGLRFVAVEITAEISVTPREPSSIVLARGRMVPLTFANTSNPGQTITPTPTTIIVTITPTPTKVATSSAAGTLASILMTIGRIIGIGFIILLILVVVMTIVTRRRENV